MLFRRGGFGRPALFRVSLVPSSPCSPWWGTFSRRSLRWEREEAVRLAILGSPESKSARSLPTAPEAHLVRFLVWRTVICLVWRTVICGQRGALAQGQGKADVSWIGW